MPPRLARLELGIPVDRDLEVDAPQALGRRAIGDLLEPDTPAGAVLDGRDGCNGQGRLTPLTMEHAADGEALLGAIGEDLDANEALQAVCAADPPDDDASRLAQRDPLRGSRA